MRMVEFYAAAPSDGKRQSVDVATGVLAQEVVALARALLERAVPGFAFRGVHARVNAADPVPLELRQGGDQNRVRRQNRAQRGKRARRYSGRDLDSRVPAHAAQIDGLLADL